MRTFPLLGLVLSGLVTVPAAADTGIYLGGSLGSATVQADVGDGVDPDAFSLDENDLGWKAFGGVNVDLLLLDLGVEAGYVNLGSPSGGGVDLDIDGWDAFGVAGFDVGPIGLFAKLGYVAWDAEVSGGGFDAGDDGEDLAWGLGARFGLGSLSVRAEYEVFDIGTAEDVYLVSAGVVWTF